MLEDALGDHGLPKILTLDSPFELEQQGGQNFESVAGSIEIPISQVSSDLPIAECKELIVAHKRSPLTDVLIYACRDLHLVFFVVEV